MFSAIRAKHDSVGHLLESRCAGATSEVFEALRHRAARSVEEADVIEREVLAGFSAPFDSFLGVHGKLGNSHCLIYTPLEDLVATVRRYCRLRLVYAKTPATIQPFPTTHAELSKWRLRRSKRSYSSFHLLV